MSTSKDAFGNPIAHNKNVAIYRVAIQKSLIARDQWQTCLNCDHKNPLFENVFCELFKAEPPPMVVVCGCADHTLQIPF